jgi:GNAT superfamily N-acetyltransferase
MIHIRRMTAADIPLGMRLKEQAGWNQTEADWRRFLALEPTGCFAAEYKDEPVGTTTACIFGKVAWIAMVLVDERVRGRGIGKALMEHALAYLDAAGVRSVRLDATALGQPLYEKLGFRAQFELSRFVGVLPAQGAPVSGLRTAQPEEWIEIFRLDSEVTGAERANLLRRLFTEMPNDVWIACRSLTTSATEPAPPCSRSRETSEQTLSAHFIDGYLTVRHGSQALQMGPCIGDSVAASLLLCHARNVYEGQRIYLDMPCANDEARHMAVSWGLTAQRRLLRMCRGPDVCEDVSRLWASSGPEKG